MSDPISGQTRRISRVNARRLAPTAEDIDAAASLIVAMTDLDDPASDFRRVAELVCDRVVRNFTEAEERTMDRLTDHLANVVAAISVVLEDRKAARLDTLPPVCGVIECKCRLSDPDGNGWDDIDTTGGAQ